MIVGTGFIGSALNDVPGCVLYAAGVSNPTCTDPAEYARDLERLETALLLPGRFVYVSTASEADSDYVSFKRKAEKAVLARGDSVVVRVPTVAGRCSNPHTLLNWLWHRISRGERFDLWPFAKRNIVTVGRVADQIERIAQSRATGIVTIRHPKDYLAIQIVRAMEEIAEKRAVFDATDVPADQPDEYLMAILESCYP